MAFFHSVINVDPELKRIALLQSTILQYVDLQHNPFADLALQFWRDLQTPDLFRNIPLAHSTYVQGQ